MQFFRWLCLWRIFEGAEIRGQIEFWGHVWVYVNGQPVLQSLGIKPSTQLSINTETRYNEFENVYALEFLAETPYLLSVHALDPGRGPDIFHPGFILTLSDGTVSRSEGWKCSSGPHPQNWTQLAFDDSEWPTPWEVPDVIKPDETPSRQDIWRNFMARYIWVKKDATESYCRTKVEAAPIEAPRQLVQLLKLVPSRSLVNVHYQVMQKQTQMACLAIHTEMVLRPPHVWELLQYGETQYTEDPWWWNYESAQLLPGPLKLTAPHLRTLGDCADQCESTPNCSAFCFEAPHCWVHPTNVTTGGGGDNCFRQVWTPQTRILSIAGWGLAPDSEYAIFCGAQAGNLVSTAQEIRETSQIIRTLSWSPQD